MLDFLIPERYDSYKHAGFTVAFGVVFMLISLLCPKLGIDVDPTFPWMVVAAFALLFAISSSFYVAFNTNFNAYFYKALASYLGLILLLSFLAYFLTGISIGDAGFYKWIIYVISFCFMVFLSLVNAVKRIVDFAQKEEWHQPNLRKHKNRK